MAPPGARYVKYKLFSLKFIYNHLIPPCPIFYIVILSAIYGETTDTTYTQETLVVLIRAQEYTFCRVAVNISQQIYLQTVIQFNSIQFNY